MEPLNVSEGGPLDITYPPNGIIGAGIASGTETQKPSAAAGKGENYFASDTGILYQSDGTNWNIVLSDTEGISAPNSGIFPNETMLIAPGAASSVLTASGGLVLAQDTTNYLWGSQSIKMTTDGAGGSNFATITFGSPVDLSAAILGLGIEIDSFTPYNDFQIRVSSDGFASANFDYIKPIYSSLSQRWVEAGLWEYITMNRGAAVGNMSPGQWIQNGTGLADPTMVNAIRFKLVDNGGSAPMTIRLGFLSHFSRPTTGIVSVTFDDSRLTQFTVAKPVMDTYRMRATCYNIGYVVENSASYGTAYFNTTQLKSLQNDSHWEIGAHAYTDDTGPMAHTFGYDGITAHDGQSDVVQLKTFLRQQKALGIDSFALPHGSWSLNSNNAVNPNTAVLDMVSQYFNTCATTYSNTVETFPCANRMKLRRYIVQSTDTAASLMAMVNAAIANKWWLILAFHNLVASPSSNTDFSSTEFNTFIPDLAASSARILPVGEVWSEQAALSLAGSGSSVTLSTAVPKVSSATAPTAGTSTSVTREDHVHPRHDWQAADHGFIAWTYDGSVAGASSTPLTTAGTLYVMKLHVPVAASVTNIITYLTTAGIVLTSGQCFAALYQNGTLLGTTADQATNWASTGSKIMAISGGPVAVGAGDVQVALWFNGTTGPAPVRSNGTSLANLGLTAAAARFATANTGVTTTAPGTLATTAALSVAYWAALS